MKAKTYENNTLSLKVIYAFATLIFAAMMLLSANKEMSYVVTVISVLGSFEIFKLYKNKLKDKANIITGIVFAVVTAVAVCIFDPLWIINTYVLAAVVISFLFGVVAADIVKSVRK